MDRVTEILALDAMFIIGTEIRTKNQLEAKRTTARIPSHWDRFTRQALAERIPDAAGDDVFGIYTHYVSGQQGEYSHIIGKEVSSLQHIPDGMVGLMIPEGEYLLFIAEGEMPGAITRAWREIQEYFAEAPEYERAYTYDFEVYDPAEPNVVTIYVAIKP